MPPKFESSGDEVARINIEDCWWTDPRRSKLIRLIGDEDKADGMSVRMWRLAQEFWGRGRALVPLEIFETLEASSKLIEAKLAKVQDDGVYVCGSSQYLDWHFERREAARVGGEKSAEARRKKTGTAQPTPKQTRSKRNQTQPSGSRSLSGSDSGSDSDLGSDSLPISQSAINPVAFYCDLWKAKNGKSPDVGGKVAGQIRQLVKDYGHARTLQIMKSYFSMPDPLFIKRGYDVGTMILNINAIAQFEVHGKIVTSEAVKQIEKQVDKIQGTKKRRSIEELEKERNEQRGNVLALKGGDNDGAA